MSGNTSSAIEFTPLVPGDASGVALVLDEPLSLWGGLDPVTSAIIDRNHPQQGELLADKIVLMPVGRGSSSASSVLAEAVRLGTAPAALILGERDEIVALGLIVADELYGTAPPLGLIRPDDYERISTGMAVDIEGDLLYIRHVSDPHGSQQ